MSKRPPEQKKRRRVTKALRRKPLARYFDIVQWLVDHDHASTRKQARELLLADKVRSDSHPLGTRVGPVANPDGTVTTRKFVDARVPIAARDRIIVGA